MGDGRKRKAVKPKSCLVPELGINSKLSTTNRRHYKLLINILTDSPPPPPDDETLLLSELLLPRLGRIATWAHSEMTPKL